LGGKKRKRNSSKSATLKTLRGEDCCGPAPVGEKGGKNEKCQQDLVVTKQQRVSHGGLTERRLWYAFVIGGWGGKGGKGLCQTGIGCRKKKKKRNWGNAFLRDEPEKRMKRGKRGGYDSEEFFSLGEETPKQ